MVNPRERRPRMRWKDCVKKDVFQTSIQRKIGIYWHKIVTNRGIYVWMCSVKDRKKKKKKNVIPIPRFLNLNLLSKNNPKMHAF